MKALSVVTHAGELICSGKKTLEIRRWLPEEIPLIDLAIVQNQHRLSMERPTDEEGMVVAVVDVCCVREWDREDAESACSQWDSGWYAWELENIRVVRGKFKAPAKRRIYSIDIDYETLSFTEHYQKK
ncbi:ASCH domain-containing protein [Planctomycetota bacterium]|nr:ASCH domain-containing protein [Planctomycetota bacterium]